jgi:pyridoxamine 5'-phosphate oxidase
MMWPFSRLVSLFRLGKGITRGLSEESAGMDPLALFGRWFRDAERSGLRLPDSTTLATCTNDGRPSARMVLLKRFGEDGFDFYTNYESRKAQELDENPRAALVLYWSSLERQVRIEGTSERLSSEDSQAYFDTRPRGARLAAWTSKQSTEVSSREELDRMFREVEARFQRADVPLPEFWGGYRVRPERIEFWQGRLNRLHDRLVFERTATGWTRTRLFP